MYAVTVAFATLFALASALPAPQEESGSQAQPPEVTPVPLPTPLPSVGLHPNGNAQKCVDVRGGVIQAGTVLQIYDCNGTDAQKFSLKRGDGQVFVTGTNFCLDVGSSPGNGAQVKLATCNKSLLQNWYYTDDDRLAVTGKGLCLDLTNGSDENGNALQVWECGTGNTNQVWTTNVLFA